MKYVGATNSFIRASFIFEAIYIGIFAMIIAIIAIYFTYGFVSQKIIELASVNSMQITIVDFSLILPEILIYFTALAIGIGLFGSIMSIKRYLDV